MFYIHSKQWFTITLILMYYLANVENNSSTIMFDSIIRFLSPPLLFALHFPKTVCVESRGTLGGTCLNVGCIPSKALLHSTHMFEHAKKDFSAHGISVSGDISMDVGKMMENKAKVSIS